MLPTHRFDHAGSQARPLARALAALLLVTGCSHTSHVRLAPIAPAQAATAAPAGVADAQPPPEGKGRIVIDARGMAAEVTEIGSDGQPRVVCPKTPCTADVSPGHHRYRLVPVGQSLVETGLHGVVSSADGTYAAAAEGETEVTAGHTQVLAASFGTDEVRRSVPAGRVVGWALLGVGAVVTIVGAAARASATSGTPGAGIDEGVAEMGVGAALVGLALWAGTRTDNVTVTERPGVVRFSGL